MNQNETGRKSWVVSIVGLIMVVAVGVAATAVVGEAAVGRSDPVLQEENESDPWEPFNSSMFSFNHDVLDQYVLKPVATAWNFVLPDVVQRGLRNAVDNTNTVSRAVNSLAQGKLGGAGRELARFTINSTVGLAGFFDIAKNGFGMERSDEDTGQTLGFYGVGSGPYLVLPFFAPMTVRDGIGSVVDAAMNPINYLIPFAAGADGGTTAGALIGITAVDAINRRSMNLDVFEGVEETVIDLYSAVRSAYLQQREAKIKE